MKLIYYIDPLNGISVRAFEGVVTKQILIRSMKMVWENPEYSLEQNHLIDMRNSDFQMDRAEIIEFVNVVVSNPNIHDRKVALLVARPQEAAVTTMYKHLSEHKHVADVFVSEYKALDYIGAPHDFCNMLKSKEAITLNF